MTRDDAMRYLGPKWTVASENRNDRAYELTLNTGQIVEVHDDGTFHVSGKGWKEINRHLQEAQWPAYAALRTTQIRRDLATLSATYHKYFSEGLNCIQFAQAPRAAIVLGWTGFIAVLQNRLLLDQILLNQALARRFPRIYDNGNGELTNIDGIRSLPDWQALELGLEMGLYGKHVHKQLDAMRDQRNNCAHVEEFAVTTDMALGFYASLVQYLQFIL